MNNYLEILQLFVTTAGDADSPLRFPTIHMDFAAATDRNALVFFPADLLPEGTKFPVKQQRFPDFTRFLELAENCETEIDLGKLKTLVDLCPMEQDLNGKMLTSDEYSLQLGHNFLPIWLAEKLLKVQELVGEEILLVHQGAQSLSPVMFWVGSVRVVIQPIHEGVLECLGTL